MNPVIEVLQWLLDNWFALLAVAAISIWIIKEMF